MIGYIHLKCKYLLTFFLALCIRAFVDIFDTPKTGFWTRLNDQPLPALPDSEGVEVKRYFDQVSKFLLAKKEFAKINPQSREAAFVQRRHFVSLSSPPSPGKSIYKTETSFEPTLILHEGPYATTSSWQTGGGDWSFFTFGNSLGSVVYDANCTPKNAPIEQQTEEDVVEYKLPMDYSGVFFIDWDQDGDEDIAILLKSGQFVFFKREGCCDECIS